MPKDRFEFKQFVIHQPFNNIMKVSTDSVLLGCFTEVSNKKTALDIGCGTGLLAFMLAQKNSDLKIVAIDINAKAIECARYNLKHSKFFEQIKLNHIALQQFVNETELKFDIIICNPPYFSKSLKSQNILKNQYRHQEQLNYDELVFCVNKLLDKNGSFWVLIPFYEMKNFELLLSKHQLFIHNKIEIFSKKTKAIPYIFVYEIKKDFRKEYESKKFYILDENNANTKEYIELTKDFYLWESNTII
jgi:tRNA1Val (adenine37-N6)-methyltransferase